MRNLKISKNYHKMDTFFLFLMLVFYMFFVITWSYIEIAKFYALNAAVWDLGISMERIWISIHTQWTITTLIQTFFFSGWQFFLTPVAFTNSYPLMLFIQVVSIGLPAILLYQIFKITTRDNLLALIFGSAYLLYAPLSGMLWFDFHFQSFFPALFIGGYYFYKKKKYTTSIFLFFLSGITRYPFSFYPFLFSLTVLTSMMVNRKKTFSHLVHEGFVQYFVLLILTIITLMINFISVGGVYGFNSNIHNTGGQIYYSDIINKFITFFIIFTPLAFLPLFSKRWILFYLPFLYLLVFTNFYAYIYPGFLFHIYGDSIAPFVFLGTIDVLGRFFNTDNSKLPLKRNCLNYKQGLLKVPKGKENQPIRILFVFILIFSLLISSLYTPYGPLNKSTSSNYDINSSIDYNLSLFQQLDKVLSFIPNNESHLLIQNDLPEALPRPLPDYNNKLTYNGNLVAGVTPFLKNLTKDNILDNRFPIKYANNNSFYSTKINFVLAYISYPPESSFYFKSNSEPSMWRIMQSLLNSGDYGVLAEASGFILLERNYSNPPKYFVPFQEYLPASSFFQPYNKTGYSSLTNVDGKNGTLWYSSPLSLPPGTYILTLNVSFSPSGNGTNISLIVNSNFTNYITSITFNDFSPSSNKQNIFLSREINFPSTYKNMQMVGFANELNGILKFYGMWITQTSPSP